ncbi:MAG: Gar1/Naf1 family protein [Nitrososphaerota archaeon]|nr:Gar1/Naf1 family protein [Nitrososphaerota archaeon]
MKRKGVIEKIVNERIVVVKLEGLINLGSTVLDNDKRPVGNVVDIIGPVKEPYAVILLRKRIKSLKYGDIVFFKPGKR